MKTVLLAHAFRNQEHRLVRRVADDFFQSASAIGRALYPEFVTTSIFSRLL